MNNLLNSTGAPVAPLGVIAPVPAAVAVATARPVSFGLAPYRVKSFTTTLGLPAHVAITRCPELANRFYEAALDVDDSPIKNDDDEQPGRYLVYFYCSDEECAVVIEAATGVPA